MEQTLNQRTFGKPIPPIAGNWLLLSFQLHSVTLTHCLELETTVIEFKIVDGGFYPLLIYYGPLVLMRTRTEQYILILCNIDLSSVSKSYILVFYIAGETSTVEQVVNTWR